jgi:hypothetical protein
VIEPRLKLIRSTHLRSVLHACWGRVEDGDVVAIVGVDEMHGVLCTVPVSDLDENGHQGEDLKRNGHARVRQTTPGDSRAKGSLPSGLALSDEPTL